jgi:hypothetical protein
MINKEARASSFSLLASLVTVIAEQQERDYLAIERRFRTAEDIFEYILFPLVLASIVQFGSIEIETY